MQVTRSGMARRVLFVVLVVWCLALSAAFVHALGNFTAIQNTQASVKVYPRPPLQMAVNETELVITVYVHLSNPGRLDVRVYDIPTELLILNRTPSAAKWAWVSQADTTAYVKAGTSVDVALRMRVDLADPSPDEQEALRHIQPEKNESEVSRTWFVDGRALFYVVPFNVRGEQAMCAGEDERCVI